MLPVGITPYYMSLLDRENPQQPLRRTVIPVTGEFLRTPGEADDPRRVRLRAPPERQERQSRQGPWHVVTARRRAVRWFAAPVGSVGRGVTGRQLAEDNVGILAG